MTTTGLAAHARAFDRWLRESALPLWASVGFDAGRGFEEALTPDGRAVADAPHRLRVQARQTWVFARAGRLGWDGPWRARAGAGLAVLESRYRRADGAYRSLVAADGSPLDEADTLYDQAFVLLAFAAVTRAGVRDMTAEAEALLGGPITRLRCDSGGFHETRGETPWQSNPLMHLFEAALAWEGAARGAPWAPLADEIAAFALERLFDGTRLREYFDARWRPAPGDPGTLYDPGHQFEWAWLLERWSRLRGRPEAGAAARRLFEAGGAGVDAARGVAVDSLPVGADPRAKAARLWPQTERLKAALILGEAADAEAACAAIARYLDTPVAGLWRERQSADGGFPVEPAPATSLYHLVCAFEALGEAQS